MATMQESEPLQQGTETSGTEREFNMFAADGVAPTTPPSQQVEVDMPEAKEEPLDFINVSSGVDHQGESEVVLPGSEAAPTSVWGKVVTGFETAKVRYYLKNTHQRDGQFITKVLKILHVLPKYQF